MFERRLADKLNYHDWKFAYIVQAQDFKFIHQKEVTEEIKEEQGFDIKEAQST